MVKRPKPADADTRNPLLETFKGAALFLLVIGALAPAYHHDSGRISIGIFCVIVLAVLAAQTLFPKRS